MNKEQLIKILKPVIKECVREAIFEDGVISTIISEALKVRGETTVVTEAKAPVRISQQVQQQLQKATSATTKAQIPQRAGNPYGDFNPFSGTKPIS
jgi:hypothetical protein